MKPLSKKDLKEFLKRFGSFIDAEIRSIDIISPTQININLACQDVARGYDWLSLEFEFRNISEAILIDNNKLSYLDMSDGIDIVYEENKFIFKVNSATLKITAAEIKYQEKQF